MARHPADDVAGAVVDDVVVAVVVAAVATDAVPAAVAVVDVVPSGNRRG